MKIRKKFAWLLFFSLAAITAILISPLANLYALIPAAVFMVMLVKYDHKDEDFVDVDQKDTKKMKDSTKVMIWVGATLATWIVHSYVWYWLPGWYYAKYVIAGGLLITALGWLVKKVINKVNKKNDEEETTERKIDWHKVILAILIVWIVLAALSIIFVAIHWSWWCLIPVAVLSVLVGILLVMLGLHSYVKIPATVFVITLILLGVYGMFKTPFIVNEVNVNQLNATTVNATTVNATTVNATTVQATTVQATEVQATQVQATTVQATEVQATQVQATTVQATEVQATQVQATTVQATQIQATQVQATEIVVPTTAPTTAPTIAPTTKPTTAPTTAPTTKPTAAPTTEPTVHQHNYTTKVVAANCTDHGYTVYTCSCGHSYKDNVKDALGHSYKSTVVAPTTSMGGYTEHKCTRCGDKYTSDVTDVLVASFSIIDKGMIEGKPYWTVKLNNVLPENVSWDWSRKCEVEWLSADTLKLTQTCEGTAYFTVTDDATGEFIRLAT